MQGPPGIEPFTEGDIDAIVRAMREGFGAMVGGSRCHNSYWFRDGAFRVETFDEGYTEEREIREAEMRSEISASPEQFVHGLDFWRRRDAEAALIAKDWARCADALDGLRAPDSALHAETLIAVGRWPGVPLTDEGRQSLVAMSSGVDLYHAFMRWVGWRQSAVVRESALAWLDRVEALTGVRAERARKLFEDIKTGG